MRTLLILLSLLLLTGCYTPDLTPKKKVVISAQVIHPPLPPQLDLSPVVWLVVTINSNSYISLTPDNYENLSKNIADITAHIEKLQSIILYYRTVHVQ